MTVPGRRTRKPPSMATLRTRTEVTLHIATFIMATGPQETHLTRNEHLFSSVASGTFGKSAGLGSRSSCPGWFPVIPTRCWIPAAHRTLRQAVGPNARAERERRHAPNFLLLALCHGRSHRLLAYRLIHFLFPLPHVPSHPITYPTACPVLPAACSYNCGGNLS